MEKNHLNVVNAYILLQIKALLKDICLLTKAKSPLNVSYACILLHRKAALNHICLFTLEKGTYAKAHRYPDLIYNKKAWCDFGFERNGNFIVIFS